MTQGKLLDLGTVSKRPSRRRERDFYPTPSWATELLLRHTPELEGDGLYDPTCGDGRMAAQICAERFAVHGLNDIDPGSAGCTHHDATRAEAWEGFEDGGFSLDWVATNPPFNVSGAIAHLALRHARVGVALLLRITWLEACGGRTWLRETPPTRLLVLPRISFTGGGMDACTYAWFIWLRKEGQWDTTNQRILYADPCAAPSLLGGAP